jgi:hypothetical protein
VIRDTHVEGQGLGFGNVDRLYTWVAEHKSQEFAGLALLFSRSRDESPRVRL